jgi:hypothetical protein
MSRLREQLPILLVRIRAEATESRGPRQFERGYFDRVRSTENGPAPRSNSAAEIAIASR